MFRHVFDSQISISETLNCFLYICKKTGFYTQTQTYACISIKSIMYFSYMGKIMHSSDWIQFLWNVTFSTDQHKMLSGLRRITAFNVKSLVGTTFTTSAHGHQIFPIVNQFLLLSCWRTQETEVISNI